MKKGVMAILLMAFAASSSYAELPFPSVQTSDMSSEKMAQTKWEVQGSIGNKVVIVNGKGDTSAVEAGSDIDGCLVTSAKVICDISERAAFNKKETGTKGIEAGKRDEELGIQSEHHTLVSFLESRGKPGYSPELGHIKFAVLDGKMIVRVAGGYYDKAETILKEAVLEKSQANGQIYYALDRNRIKINYNYK